MAKEKSAKRHKKSVPPVDPEHVIEAHRKVVADREEFGSADPTVSVVGLFAKRMEPHDDMNFDPKTFMPMVLEEAEIEGKA